MNRRHLRLIAVLSIVSITSILVHPVQAQETALDEAALIGVLQSDAAWAEKQAACRGLQRVGTETSIPILAALLTDETMSHMARYALEMMPYPAVDEALREALPKAAGMPKTGIVISMGVRRDAQAVPLLIPLLKDADLELVRAAAGALGRIATPGAIEALSAMHGASPEAVLPAVAEGLFSAAQRLCAQGKREEAVPIYEDLLGEDWPMSVRMGAYRGRAYVRPEQTSSLVLIAMLGHEPAVYRGIAAQIIAETTGEKETKFYAEALTRVPVEGQVALLRGLAGRGDRAARPGVAAALGSPDKQVKLAAMKALGTLGSAADVAAMAALLGAEDAEIVDAAKAALLTLQADGVDAAIARGVSEAPTGVQVHLLALLADRRAAETVPTAVSRLGDSDASVRIAALRALVLTGGDSEAPVLIAAIANAADAAERSAAEKALSAVASRGGEAVAPVLLEARNGADADTHVALLRALARIGNPEILTAMSATLEHADEQVSAEALRLLSEWASLDAVPHLRTLAGSADLRRQVLGMRGYVRLARTVESRRKRSAMLTEAMGLAQRPEEKKLVIAAWGAMPTRESLEVLTGLLEDISVRDEAASALVSVADELAKKGETNKARAVKALKAVLKQCENTEIRKSAELVLERIK